MDIENGMKLALIEFNNGNYQEASYICRSILEYDSEYDYAWLVLGLSNFCNFITPPIDISTNVSFEVAAVFRCFFRGLSLIQDGNTRFNREALIVENIATRLNYLRDERDKMSRFARELENRADKNLLAAIGVGILGVSTKNKTIAGTKIVSDLFSETYGKSGNFDNLSKQCLWLKSYYFEIINETKDAAFNLIDNFSSGFSENVINELKLSLLAEWETKDFFKKIKRKAHKDKIQAFGVIIIESLSHNLEYQKLVLDSQKHLKNKKYRQAIFSAKRAYDFHNEVEMQLLNGKDFNANIPNAILDKVISTSRKKIIMQAAFLIVILALVASTIFYIVAQHQHLHIYFSKSS